MIGRWTCLAFAAVVSVFATAACRANSDGDSEKAQHTDDLVFLETNIAPARLVEGHTAGGVITVRLANTKAEAVRINSVTPIADEGLTVTYLGYSDCNRVCPGAVNWSKEADDDVRRNKLGTAPIKLASKQQDLSLMFRLEVRGGDMRTLLEKCTLRLSGARMRLSDGRLVDVTAPDRKPIGGLKVSVEPPGQAKECSAS